MRSISPEDYPLRSEDETLRAALHRVEVPVGLPDRIKRAIDSERKAATLIDSLCGDQPMTAQCELPTGRPSRRLLSRRWFLSAATAAGIAGIGTAIHYSTRPLEPSWLAQECFDTLRKIESEPTAWQPLTEEYQLEIARIRILRQPVRCIGVRNLPVESPVVAARAFRLDAGDGRGLILFRIDLSRKLIGLSSRLEPLQGTSGDWAIAAMSEHKQIIALAVAGTNRDLLNYIRISLEA